MFYQSNKMNSISLILFVRQIFVLTEISENMISYAALNFFVSLPHLVIYIFHFFHE
jgi:hypothetical protein